MATNLGWLGDLVAQILRLDGNAIASRRVWNLSSRFTATDDATNEWTDIDIDMSEVAGEAPTPAALNGVSATGTSNTFARGDHAHKIGVDTDDASAIARQSCTIAYDASGVATGVSYGLVVDAEVVSGGTDRLFECREAGAARFSVQLPASNARHITMTTERGAPMTDGIVTADVIPDTGEEIIVERGAQSASSVSASSSFSVEIDTLSDRQGHFELHVSSINGGGDSAMSSVAGSWTNSSGTVTLGARIDQTDGGADDDTIASSVSGNTITIELTNEASAAKSYYATWTVSSWELP